MDCQCQAAAAGSQISLYEITVHRAHSTGPAAEGRACQSFTPGSDNPEEKQHQFITTIK